MGSVKIDVAVLKTQMAEIMYWFRIVAGVFIVGVGTQIWQLILLKRKK
jgi:hypothetical protein